MFPGISQTVKLFSWNDGPETVVGSGLLGACCCGDWVLSWWQEDRMHRTGSPWSNNKDSWAFLVLQRLKSAPVAQMMLISKWQVCLVLSGQVILSWSSALPRNRLILPNLTKKKRDGWIFWASLSLFLLRKCSELLCWKTYCGILPSVSFFFRVG